jgi:propanol-preferring alcohol dehydrogenase
MLLDGSFIGSEEPVTLGHEGVGTIEEMGDKVKGFNLGDRVGFLPNKACCFTCRGCQIHNLNCENLPPNRKSLLQGFT